MLSLTRLLIAYDGTECSESAIHDLIRAGMPDEADVLVATTADIHAVVSSEVVKFKAEEASELTTMAFREIQRAFPKWKIEVKTCVGDHASELVKIAKSWGADLIVIGSHGKSLVPRFFSGSVSNKVLINSPCSVRISRGSRASRETPERIIVALDGSASAKAVLEVVKARSWSKDSEIKVVAVNDPSKSMAVVVDYQVAEEHKGLKQVVESAVEVLRLAGFHASGEVKSGEPKQVLIHEAKAWDADCIFVGTGTLRGTQRLFSGSASEAVAAQAPCSVEVVHSDKKD